MHLNRSRRAALRPILVSQHIKHGVARPGRRAAGRQGVLHQLPHHSTVGRHADPPVGLLGDEAAQRRKTARARLKPALATRKSSIVIGEPALGQRLTEAAFCFRPTQTFGFADTRLAQARLIPLAATP